jgi:xylan 1,4-beta-xylosidase
MVNLSRRLYPSKSGVCLFRLLVALLLQITWFSMQGSHPVFSQVAPAKATVSFGTTVKTPSMSGFLHSLFEPIPGDRITALQPVWWRIQPHDDFSLYNKARSYGARVQLVVSDGYGYPMNQWYDRGAPWENNGEAWENYVRSLAREYKGKDVYWDIWNEPDSREWNKNLFWSGTRSQFFETYKRAYRVLREELGSDVLIGGPSFANFEPDDLKAFVQYCSQNKLEINFLTWHELSGADEDISSVSSHLVSMKNYIQQFPALKYQFTLINESVGPQTHLFPGDILGFLYHLEAGGAQGSNKACWDAQDGSQNCYNGSLDGLLSPNNYQPRAAWWIYKYYADSHQTQVSAVSRSSKKLAIFANQKQKQILLGYFGGKYASPTLSTEILATQLRSIGITGKKVEVSYFKIPATGESPLLNPILVKKEVLPVTASAYAIIKPPPIKLHDGLLLKMSNPSAK